MNSSWIQQLLSLIKEEWQALPEECKPRGVWITLHAPLAPSADHPLQDALIHQAWFLEGGMSIPQERKAEAFTRFWMTHFVRPWDEAGYASPDPRFSGHCYSLGLAAFAPYAGSLDLCLETIWGGRWGWSRRLTFTPDDSIRHVQGLWIA